jgi:hypothetical protein
MIFWIVVAILAVALGALTVFSNRRVTRQASAAMADRPGWSLEAKAPELKQRYRTGTQFTHTARTFTWRMSGPVQGGGQAEVFRYRANNSQGRTQTSWNYTVAVVVFPHVLPAIQASPVKDTVTAGAPALFEPVYEVAKTYEESNSGPAWRGVRGYATDPEAARAVFRPEVLERTRELAMPWRMNGHAAIMIKDGWATPAQMLGYVDAMTQFASYIPEPVWQAAAAADPDPWPGPTPQRPA